MGRGRSFCFLFGTTKKLCFGHIGRNGCQFTKSTIANNAGLVNDPFNYVDEYQQVLTKFLGNKGGDGLKDFRQHRFNQKWNDLTPEEQTPEMAEVIADLCNHESGIIKSGFGKYSHAASIVGFAPKLEASRWAYLLGERLMVPTFGPSGIADLLNCCVKNLFTKLVNHLLIISGE